MTAEIQVVVNMAPASMPATDRMLGLTARIYAIVRNVVIPPMISFFTDIVLASKPKSFCSINCLMFLFTCTKVLFILQKPTKQTNNYNIFFTHYASFLLSLSAKRNIKRYGNTNIDYRDDRNGVCGDACTGVALSTTF